MAKGKGGAATPAKVQTGANRPNGKAYKKFIKVMVFDERRGRYKQVRVPNTK